MTPELEEVALGIVRRSFEKQSTCEVAGTVGHLFLTILKTTDEKNVLLKETQEMAAQEHKVQTAVDSLKNEMTLI